MICLRTCLLVCCALLACLAWRPAQETAAQPSPRREPGGTQAPGARDPDRLEEAYRANNIGVAYLEQYNYEAAAKAFRRSLEIDPRNPLANVNLTIALLYVPDLQGASAQASAALQIVPDALQPHYVLGLIARSENRVDEGVAAFQKVRDGDPNDLGARVNLGQLLMQQRKYAEAVELFRGGYETEPYNVTAAYNLGVALTRSGQVEQGREMMQRFQALRESGYGTTFSNNYLEQGRYAEALISRGTEPGLVDRAVPEVAFREALLEGVPPANTAAGPVATITLADVDRDGRLDVFAGGGSGVVILKGMPDGRFQRMTALDVPFPASAVVVGDYDNDLKPDVLVAGKGLRLFKQEEGARFTDATTTAGIRAFEVSARAVALVDVDHDGDLDIVIAGVAGDVRRDEPSGSSSSVSGTVGVAPLLLRNNGNGTFEDTTKGAGLSLPLSAVGIVPTDFDNRRDVDLLIAAENRAPALFKNQRDGSFKDVSADVGLPGALPFTVVAAGDVNKDDFTDLFLGRADGPGVFAMSDGNGRFRAVPAPDGTKGATAAVLFDYDNDGLLDLITASPQGMSVLRGLGSEWEDVTERAVPSAWRPAAPGPASSSPPASGPDSRTADDPPRLLAAGDLDGDGDEDLVVRFASGRVLVATNDGGNRRPSVSVRLTGRVSNRSGVGSKVELRAGSLRSRTELYATSPAVGPADLIFGLGRRDAPDVVRILWPAGILQAELPESGSEERHLTLDITELDRKPSSCPFLFTWNGDGFEFVTDFLGGGEMGYWAAPGVRNVPDPDEYVRITGEQLRARDGRYELRVTNELEEALFLDRLELVSVIHPAGTEVYPLEGLTSPARSGLTVLVSRDERPPRRAIDDRGRDVTLRLAKLDRQFVDDLPLLPIRGYASPHTLTIDTGAPSGSRRVVLLLTGWTDYAFSSDNVAAHQAGYNLAPPSLQVRDARGQWRTVIDQIGIPVGRPQTIVVDLTGKFLSESREVRIVTSMRVYWDRVLVDASGRAEVLTADDLAAGRSASGVRVARVDPMSAVLRIRGFSAEVSADGREPFGYDYERVTSTSPWKQMPGRYTKEGSVRDLLKRTDDRFVVSAPGDEIAVAFDANAQPAPPHAFDRTFLLFAVGYSKEMDLSSASPDQAWPLPFKGMTQYPYAWPEAYPSTPEHRDYVQRYNTRVVGRMVPVLESLLVR